MSLLELLEEVRRPDHCIRPCSEIPEKGKIFVAIRRTPRHGWASPLLDPHQKFPLKLCRTPEEWGSFQCHVPYPSIWELWSGGSATPVSRLSHISGFRSEIHHNQQIIFIHRCFNQRARSWQSREQAGKSHFRLSCPGKAPFPINPY